MKYKGITIHKRKNCNTWYTRFRKNGKIICISAKTQKECYELLKKQYQNPPIEEANIKKPTFIEWYNKWLELYKIGKVKENTLRDYKSLLKNISEDIQNKEITKIKLEEIIKSINECNKERQRQKLYDFYNMIFQKAEDNEIITKNILTKLEKPKHIKQHSKALNNKEQLELINTCKKIKNADVLLIAMYQGLRRGEALGLTIDNIDFDKNTLTINKAYNQHNQFDTTKNKQSIRTMPLFNKTKKILLKYKNVKQRIFDITTKQYEKLIEEIKNKSKKENLKIKDMRATFITNCKNKNIPNHIIQSWVGHKIGSIVTDSVYTTHNKDIDDKYINILNE